MFRAEDVLRWYLRLVGTVSLLALPCALMPFSWMDATHRWLGLGPLPAAPVVPYLARSLSLFYALLGGLLWTASFDLPRHRAMLSYVGSAMVLFGLTLCWVDFAAGLPKWWVAYEGPWDAMLGALILLLNRSVTRWTVS